MLLFQTIFRLYMQGTGYRVQGTGYKVQGTGTGQAQGVGGRGYRVQGTG